MQRIISFGLAILISFGLLAGNLSADVFSSQALQTAEQFIRLIDRTDYEAAFLSASVYLRTLDRKADWIAQQQRSRTLLGAPLERHLNTIKSRDSYPNLPDGDYLLIYFEVQTEHKTKASEILLVARQEVDWTVVSYAIR
jgi:hypothetical protein